MTSALDDAQLCAELPRLPETLPEDVLAFAACLDESHPFHLRRYAAAAVGYVLQSVDLIADSIEVLGYLDDALVLRLAARFAVGDGSDAPPGLARLAREANVVDGILGADLSRFADYVRSLREGTVRGRPVDAVLEDPDAVEGLREAVRAWANAYRAPTFDPDPRWLIKLRSFFATRLP